MNFPSVEIQLEYFTQGATLGGIVFLTALGIKVFRKMSNDSGYDQGL
jgi:hypothetical protein